MHSRAGHTLLPEWNKSGIALFEGPSTSLVKEVSVIHHQKTSGIRNIWSVIFSVSIWSSIHTSEWEYFFCLQGLDQAVKVQKTLFSIIY